MTKPTWKHALSACLTAVLTITAVGGALPLTVSAAPTMGEAVKMEWKNLDKAYVAIVIDDNNAELEGCYELITEEYGFPLCAAVTVDSVKRDPSSKNLLKKIEQSGGEILSHTYTHTVLNSKVSESVIKREIWGSYAYLTAAGFNINGIITAGGGGTEDTSLEYRKKLEPYTSLCYKYSDYYGASTQYYNGRYWVSGGLTYVKKHVNKAIADKSFVALASHWLTRSDVGGQGSVENWRKVLDWLKEQEEAGKLEVVTYREAHEKATWAKKVNFDEVVEIPHDWGSYLQEDEGHAGVCKDCKIKGAVQAHNLKHIKKVEPTCEDEGCEQYYQCEQCEVTFSDSKGKTAVDVYDLGIPATGKHVDKNDDDKCDVCDERLSGSTTTSSTKKPSKSTTKSTSAVRTQDDDTSKTTLKTSRRTRSTADNSDTPTETTPTETTPTVVTPAEDEPISAEIFQQAKDEDKPIIVEAADGAYRWSFDAQDIVNVDAVADGFDCRVYRGDAVDAADAAAVGELTDKPHYAFSFAHRGELPGVATVSLDVDEAFAGKRVAVYAVQDGNAVKECVVTVGEDARLTLDIANGMVRYIVETDEAQTPSVTVKPSEPKEDDPASKGDGKKEDKDDVEDDGWLKRLPLIIGGVGVLLVAGLGVASAFIFKKKKPDETENTAE